MLCDFNAYGKPWLAKTSQGENVHYRDSLSLGWQFSPFVPLHQH